MKQAMLFQILQDPLTAKNWSSEEWSNLFREARSTGLLGRIGSTLFEFFPEVFASCPTGLRDHFEASARVCKAQHAEVVREAKHIAFALRKLNAPVILLKGAGYAVAGLPAAKGRVFSDVDILVPKSKLAQAESLLTLSGWMISESSEYNQGYYRKWMHELPPMRHLQRGTTLDVHHTILPETARLRPDPAKLIASAVPIAGALGLFVLSPVDRVLHSLTHLFMNEDMSHGLRDLSDLDLLLREWGPDAGLWDQLVTRAKELELSRPLFYAVEWLPQTMGTPVPEHIKQALTRFGPSPPLRQLMHAIWQQALAAPTRLGAPWPGKLALAALYLRGHWLRMPPWLLLRHLSIKALGLHKNRTSGTDPTLDAGR
jgi:Uncharacterised nucleotidyltransferase